MTKVTSGRKDLLHLTVPGDSPSLWEKSPCQGLDTSGHISTAKSRESVDAWGLHSYTVQGPLEPA